MLIIYFTLLNNLIKFIQWRKAKRKVTFKETHTEWRTKKRKRKRIHGKSKETKLAIEPLIFFKCVHFLRDFLSYIFIVNGLHLTSEQWCFEYCSTLKSEECWMKVTIFVYYSLRRAQNGRFRIHHRMDPYSHLRHLTNIIRLFSCQVVLIILRLDSLHVI